MPPTDTQIGSQAKPAAPGIAAAGQPKYQITFVDSGGTIASLVAGLREFFNPPKRRLSSKYYQGEAALPITEMRPWWRDLPDQLRAFVAKPTDPIGIYNRRQFWKRIALASLGAALFAAPEVYFHRTSLLVLAILLGFIAGELAGVLVFKLREYPPEIWRDYKPQEASWVNSLLVHAVLVTALILPYLISQWLAPKKPAAVTAVIISPYLPLPPAAQKAGGGGGGGNRTPKPPSTGKIPHFSKTQLAPPMAKIPNIHPILPVQSTLLGPPQMKLPDMAQNAQWGDPLHGVPGPPSEGPGTSGGIGSGSGGGIGEGNGAGFGQGEGAGAGGGPFQVGGNVSAPVPIYKPEPPYSEEARKAKYQGTCILMIEVNAQGLVTSEQVVKQLGMGLDEKALETVKTWKFIPAKRNGAPVPVLVDVEVTFRLF